MPKKSSDSNILEKCIFCQIVRGETNSHIVYEDDLIIAFLDHRPLNHGHVLVVPKQHFDTLDDLPQKFIPHLFSMAQTMSKAVQSAYDAEGSLIAINNRVSQSVPHFHIHVVPRWKKDKLFSKLLFWARKPYKNNEEMKSAAEKVKSILEKTLDH